MEFDLQKGTIRPTISSTAAPTLPPTTLHQQIPTTTPAGITQPLFQPFTSVAVPTTTPSTYVIQQPNPQQFVPSSMAFPSAMTANLPTTTAATIPTSPFNINVTSTGGVSLEQLKELLSTVLTESKQQQQPVTIPAPPQPPSAVPQTSSTIPFELPSTVSTITTGVQRLVPIAGVPAIPSVLEPQNAAAGVTISAGPTGLVQIRPSISTSAAPTPAAAIPETIPTSPVIPKVAVTTAATLTAPTEITAAVTPAIQKPSVWSRIPRWVIYAGIGVLVIILIWMIRRFSTKRTEKEKGPAERTLAKGINRVRQTQKYARPSGHPSELLALPPPPSTAYRVQTATTGLQNPITAAMHAIPPSKPSLLAATPQRPSASSAALIAGQKSIQSAEAKVATQRVAASVKMPQTSSATTIVAAKDVVRNTPQDRSAMTKKQQVLSASMVSTNNPKKRTLTQQLPYKTTSSNNIVDGINNNDDDMYLVQYNPDDSWDPRQPNRSGTSPGDPQSTEEYEVFVTRTQNQGTNNTACKTTTRPYLTNNIHIPRVFDGTEDASLLSKHREEGNNNHDDELMTTNYTSDKRTLNNNTYKQNQKTLNIVPAWNDYVMVTHANNGSASHVGGSSAFLPDSTMWQAYPIDEIMPRQARPN